jgi:hypothetical protein
MDSILSDPEFILVPPRVTRLVEMKAGPYPGGKSTQVVQDFTVFLPEAYIELDLKDSTGVIASTPRIAEPVKTKPELFLHIRKPPNDTAGQLILFATLCLANLGESDQRPLSIVFPSPTQ